MKEQTKELIETEIGLCTASFDCVNRDICFADCEGNVKYKCNKIGFCLFKYNNI